MTGKAHEANETTKRTPVANRKFKDTVFRMLFSDKEALLSLYNAINNSHYTDSGALEIVTLENAIYMGMKNDLAFILDMNLYLYEHQSHNESKYSASGFILHRSGIPEACG